MRRLILATMLFALGGCEVDRDGAVPATIAHFDRGGVRDGMVVYIATRTDEAKLESGIWSLLTRGDTDFIIGPDMHREGNKMVRESAAATRHDLLIVLGEHQDAQMRTYADVMMRNGLRPPEPEPLPQVSVIDKGREIVAGFPGTLYRIAYQHEDESGYVEVVLTQDARLKDVGRLFALLLAPGDALPRDIYGRENPVAAALAKLAARGTVLRIAVLKPGRAVPDDLYRLTAVEDGWTDPARFKLPVRTYDLEGLRQNRGVGTLFRGAEGFSQQDAI